MSSGGGGVVGLVVGMTMAASVGPVDWRLDPVSHMFLELAPYAFTIAGAIVGGIVGLVFSLNSAR
ncbi:MAG: hypothetical protein HYX68_08635 [Planctomycetes bacterium]|nr:hypothetical protein [Planctomycetota bacterium]